MNYDVREVELVDGARRLGARFVRPVNAFALYVFAHGAGAGMNHAFMAAAAAALADGGLATLRFNFPYMDGARRAAPDRHPTLVSTIRAATALASELAPDLPLIAGGKSMGGRMTSHAQAEAALPRVRGIVFFGFPLHAPGKNGTARAEHLSGVKVPMLFLQGTRDALADLDRMREVCAHLGALSTLHVVDGADHSFKVLKRSGRTNADAFDEIVAATIAFARRVTG